VRAYGGDGDRAEHGEGTLKLRHFALAVGLTLGLGCGSAGVDRPAVTTVDASNSSDDSTGTIGRDGIRRPKAGAAELGATLALMPKGCDDLRVFLNGSKLMAGDLGPAVDQFVSLVADLAKGEKGGRARRAVHAALAHGLSFSSIREFSVCARRGGGAVMAMTVDEKSLKGSFEDVLRLVFEAVDDKPLAIEHESGLAVFPVADEFAVLTEGGVLVTGLPKDDLAAIASSPNDDVAVGFEDATSYILWCKAYEGTPGAVTLTIADGRTDYQIRVVMPPPERFKDAFAKSADDGIAQIRAWLDGAASKMESSATKVDGTFVRTAKITMDGGKVVVSASMPKKFLADAVNLAASDPAAIKKAMEKH
jgi:hypothetical protein